MFNPGGPIDHLRACSFGNVARVALWGGSRLDAAWSRSGLLWQMHDSEYHLPKERTRNPHVLRLIAVFSRSQTKTWSGQSRTARGDGSWGGERMSGNAME